MFRVLMMKTDKQYKEMQQRAEIWEQRYWALFRYVKSNLNSMETKNEERKWKKRN